MALLRLWSVKGSVQTDILATSGQEGVFDEEARALGARIHYVRYGKDRLLQFAREYRALLRTVRFDAIHDHQDYASGWHYASVLGSLPAIRVTHVHNPWLHIAANYGVTTQRRTTAVLGREFVKLLATHICGTSTNALVSYGFVPGRPRGPRTAVVHCGLDTNQYSALRDPDRSSVRREFGFPDDARIILFVGRLDRDLEVGQPRNHKNSWLAVLVAREAAAADTRVRLLMAGAGEVQRREIEARIASWSLSDRMKLLGVRDDIGRLMRAADVLLFPSSEEGLGMVAVEAQAAGLPVLASSAIPREAVVIPSLFESLPLEESRDRWAKTLLDMMQRPRPDPAFCKAALEASDFAIDRSAARLEAIYRT